MVRPLDLFEAYLDDDDDDGAAVDEDACAPGDADVT